MLYKIDYRLRSEPDVKRSQWVRFAASRTEAVTRFMDWFFREHPDDAVKVEGSMEVSVIGDMSAVHAIDDAAEGRADEQR